jgi:hypothetical protein
MRIRQRARKPLEKQQNPRFSRVFFCAKEPIKSPLLYQLSYASCEDYWQLASPSSPALTPAEVPSPHAAPLTPGQSVGPSTCQKASTRYVQVYRVAQ